MQLHVNAVEASELPKVEFLAASDPFLTLQVSGMASIQSTSVIENTQNPIWNQEFHFQLMNSNPEKLSGVVKSRNIVSEDIVLGTFEISLSNLKIGEISDKWYKIISAPDLKTGASIRIILQIAPSGHPAFQPYIVGQPMMGMYGQPAVPPMQPMFNPMHMVYGKKM